MVILSAAADSENQVKEGRGASTGVQRRKMLGSKDTPLKLLRSSCSALWCGVGRELASELRDSMAGRLGLGFEFGAMHLLLSDE